jgi:hypothetical protein
MIGGKVGISSRAKDAAMPFKAMVSIRFDNGGMRRVAERAEPKLPLLPEVPSPGRWTW